MNSGAYIVLVIGMLSLNSCTAQTRIVSTNSPDKSYKVTFFEQSRTNNRFLPAYELKMKVEYHDSVIIDDWLLYSSKYDKRAFSKRYPRITWQSQNILKLSNREAANANSCIYLIRNKSSKTILYLRVTGQYKEYFLAFHLEPGAAIQLASRGDLSLGNDLLWVEAQGVFTNETEIHGGVNFRYNNVKTQNTNYCINIRNDSIEISSLNFEGYEHEYTKEELSKFRDFDKLSPESLPRSVEKKIPIKLTCD